MDAPHTTGRLSFFDQNRHVLYMSIIAVQALLLAWLGATQPRSQHQASNMLFLPCHQQQQNPSTTSTNTASSNTTCELKHRVYFPSSLEQNWLDHVSDWQNRFCKVAHSNTPAIDSWLATVARLNPPRAYRPAADSIRPDPAVFSRFVSTYTCRGPPSSNGSSSSSGAGAARTTTTNHSSSSSSEAVTSVVRRTTWIEPLALGLRHPRALCHPKARSTLMDRNYLLMASAADHAAASLHQRCVGRSCQRLYFDLGAGTFQDSKAARNFQNSQAWLYDVFLRGGLEFDRMLLWEATQIRDPVLLKTVPQQLQYKYQYFNVPVGMHPRRPNHPLQMLRALAQPGDFVVFKLDLDNSAVEAAVVKELLRDPDLLGLIDEFIFEYHVRFKEMVRAGWGRTVDRSKDLADAYALFLELRRRGVRAHSWV